VNEIVLVTRKRLAAKNTPTKISYIGENNYKGKGTRPNTNQKTKFNILDSKNLPKKLNIYSLYIIF